MNDVISIREATEEDLKTVYVWRNDVVTRDMFFQSNEVSFKEHSSWFNRAIKSANIEMYINSIGDSRQIGLVRFTKLSGEYDISIIVAPEERGKGYSKSILAGTLRIFFSKRGKRAKVVAKIKKQNLASLGSFSSVGFKEIEETPDVSIFCLTWANFVCKNANTS